MARGDVTARLESIGSKLDSPMPSTRLAGVNEFESFAQECVNVWRVELDRIRPAGASDANIQRAGLFALEVRETRAAVDVLRSENRPGLPSGLQERLNVAAGTVDVISRDVESSLDDLLSQFQSMRSGDVSIIPTVRASDPVGGGESGPTPLPSRPPQEPSIRVVDTAAPEFFSTTKSLWLLVLLAVILLSRD